MFFPEKFIGQITQTRPPVLCANNRYSYRKCNSTCKGLKKKWIDFYKINKEIPLLFPFRVFCVSVLLFFFFYSESLAQCPVPTHPATIQTQPTCTIRTGTIKVTNPAPGPGVIYSLSGKDNITSGIFTDLAAGIYIVTVNYGQGCISLPLSVTIDPPPPIPPQPTATPTHPTCLISTGNININTPAPEAGLSYSIDETDYSNITGVFSNLAPGTYPVTVKNSFGCISPALSVTINAPPPVPPTPTATLTQPNCTVATGTIIISNPAPATSISYSVNGSDYSNTSGIFNSLAPSTYSVTAKNSHGCISPALNVTINQPPPVPVQPTATTTQPGCTTATGSIVINTPTPATGISYSINGVDYSNTTGIFNSLAPNTYSVTVKNSSGCISPLLSITINAQPPTPLQSTVTLTQPGCTISTGTIKVNSPVPASGISYSINGTDYSNTTGNFDGVIPGNYNLTVKNSFGCISPGRSININTPPPIPVQPTSTVTQPTCMVGTGSIKVNTPAPGSGISYSIDGKDYSNTTGLFSGLPPNVYSVTVKNSEGCLSPLLSITLSLPQSTLAATAIATNIACGQRNGTITVNVTGGISPFNYSLNGATPVAGNIFTGLAAGTFKITVKDAAGCTVDASAIVGQIGSTLAATAIATDIPCGQNTGTIIVNVTGGISPFTYSLNGASAVTSNTFTGLSADNYKVTVKDAAGCSVDANAIVKQAAATFSATATATDIPCGQNAGTITVNVNGGISPFAYSLNGATPVASNIFTGLAAGTYKITVKDAAGCSMDENVVIRQIGSTLAANAKAADIACGQSTSIITVNVTGGSSPFTYSLNGAAPVATNIFTGVVAGTYKITVKDEAGCSADANVVIKKIDCFPISGPKIFVPTAFTPDNNGKNDYLQPYLINIRELNYFKIYNRWGQLVFSTTEIGKGWDGNINGIQQPGETYTWILKCIDIDGKLINQSGRSILIR